MRHYATVSHAKRCCTQLTFSTVGSPDATPFALRHSARTTPIGSYGRSRLRWPHRRRGCAASRCARFASEALAYLLVFLDVPWGVIDARIARRTEQMLDTGLVEEAERIGVEATAANAVGYPQARTYLRGWSTKEELRESLARATRRYARRQRAWFRGEPATLWLRPDAVKKAVREKLRWSAKRG